MVMEVLGDMWFKDGKPNEPTLSRSSVQPVHMLGRSGRLDDGGHVVRASVLISKMLSALCNLHDKSATLIRERSPPYQTSWMEERTWTRTA
jgi:hypothetical protein